MKRLHAQRRGEASTHPIRVLTVLHRLALSRLLNICIYCSVSVCARIWEDVRVSLGECLRCVLVCARVPLSFCLCTCAYGQETKGGCWSGRGPLQEELEWKSGGQGLGPPSRCSGPVPPVTATPHLLHISSGSGTIHNTPSSMSLLSGPLQ